MNRISLHVITMRREKELARLLGACFGYVDTIRVCDGGGDKATQEVCKLYDAEYVFRPWDDRFDAQDNILLDRAEPGEWILIMDDDELPSQPLLRKMRLLIRRAETLDRNMISLPCLLILDDKPQCSLNRFITEVRNGTRSPFRKYWLFEFDDSVRSYGSPHRNIESNSKWRVLDQPYPYYHIKTRRSFILNDCVHAVINPICQGYTEQQAFELNAIRNEIGWRSSRDVIPTLEFGTVTDSLREFMRKYKDEVHRPISRWFWAYYFLLKREPIEISESDPSYLAYVKYMTSDPE